MKKQDKHLDFTGHKIFIGLDVHKKTWRMATCTQNTNPTNWPVVIREPFVENLKDHLDKHFHEAEFECAYEAGFSGFWIQKALEKVGIKTIVVHAVDIPTSDKDRKQKEDKRDARKIAKALKNGDLQGIYVPEDQALADRSVVRERYSIAKNGRRVKCQIKSHMALYNIDIPKEYTEKHWSKIFINWLQTQRDQRKDVTLELLLLRLDITRKMQLQANKILRQMALTPEKKELYIILISVPGIGMLTAMLLMTELIEMNRFGSFDQLCSYVGFIPTTNSSGDKEGKGHLTKRCNARVKSAMVESSWAAIRGDKGLLLKYEELKKRMIGQKAIVRIARILLRRVRSVWISGQHYKKE